MFAVVVSVRGVRAPHPKRRWPRWWCNTTGAENESQTEGYDMHWFDYFLIGWFLLGLTLMAAQVGKPRKPIEGSTMALAIAIDAAIIAGIVLTAGSR